MDTSKLLTSLGVGLVIGCGLMFVITAIALPASYAMNRFIYHSTVMRLLLGIIAGCGSVVSLLILIIMLMFQNIQRAHYFGMFPMFISATNPDTKGLLYTLYELFSHPFQMMFEDSGTMGDKQGYIDSLKHLIVEDKDALLTDPKNSKTMSVKIGESEMTTTTMTIIKQVVNEELFEKIREAGYIVDLKEWKTHVNALSEPCKWMFGL